MIKLALPVPGIRRGLVGSLPVGPDYMAGVRARARMLAKACRFERHDGAANHGADPRQGDLPQDPAPE